MPPSTDEPVTAMRSRIMSAIRGKDTKPEMKVRRHLHAAGLRFSLHRKDLPGRPDIVLRKYGVAVLVQGCFWHGHDCKVGKMPKTRAAWWAEKIARNKGRDAVNLAKLRALGWRAIEVWECELRRPDRLDALVEEIRSTEPNQGRSQLNSRVIPPAALG